MVPITGFEAMNKIIEPREPVNESPYLFAVRMENVGSINMSVASSLLIILAVAVASDMIPLIDHKTLITRIRQDSSTDRTIASCSNHKNLFFHRPMSPEPDMLNGFR